MYPAIAEYFRGKSVLLVGFGREGQSTFRFLRAAYPQLPLTIADCRPVTPPDAYTTCICGTDYLEAVNRFSLVMKSPGISFKSVEIAEGTEVTCQTDLFLRFADCKKIGVTGSKGKTTTSTLIYEMLRAAGRDCRLIGNIGVPVFDALNTLTPDTIAVIELSSHQLEFTKASPQVAVLTNLYEEHLEHYKGGFAGYVQAKSHIALYQSAEDLFLYNATQGLSQIPCLQSIPAESVGISADALLPFALENPHLAGRHNRQDVLFAIAAAKRFGATDADCASAVRAFGGIANRMENIGTYRGITFYNDCIATIPHAVLCAVEALQTVDTLILGGKDRGLSYTDFVQALQKTQVRNIIGTPDTGHDIVRALQESGTKQNAMPAADLEEAVRLAFTYTQRGKICLLSPAASSYNVYRNFEEKGAHFKALVQEMGGEPDTV